MDFENLDQRRAADAIAHRNEDFSGADGGGSVVKDIPTMIRNNGFLGALAFAIEKQKRDRTDGYYNVFKCIAEHLHKIEKTDCSDVDGLLNFLTSRDSAELRDVTAESLLYLNYLRRFAVSQKKGK